MTKYPSWVCPDCQSQQFKGRCNNCGYVNRERWADGEIMDNSITIDKLKPIEDKITARGKILKTIKIKDIFPSGFTYEAPNFYKVLFKEWKREYKKLGSPILSVTILETIDKEKVNGESQSLSALAIEALQLLGAFGEKMQRNAHGVVRDCKDGIKPRFKGNSTEAKFLNKYGLEIR